MINFSREVSGKDAAAVVLSGVFVIFNVFVGVKGMIVTGEEQHQQEQQQERQEQQQIRSQNFDWEINSEFHNWDFILEIGAAIIIAIRVIIVVKAAAVALLVMVVLVLIIYFSCIIIAVLVIAFIADVASFAAIIAIVTTFIIVVVVSDLSAIEAPNFNLVGFIDLVMAKMIDGSNFNCGYVDAAHYLDSVFVSAVLVANVPKCENLQIIIDSMHSTIATIVAVAVAVAADVIITSCSFL